MDNWRPAGWKNPYGFIPEGNDRGVYEDSPEFCAYEAGADAILAGLVGKVKSQYWATSYSGKLGDERGWWVFIPDLTSK